ncbi:MAG: S41 family peptidase [Acidobacteriota bacterium]
MSMSRRRHYLLVPIVIAICALTAGIFSGGGRASAATPSEDAASQSLRTFSAVYDAVEKNFADPVKPEKSVYKGAIPGMLRTLDPHSNFFDPRDFQELREGQRGTYYGVGMQVATRNGQTIVIAPFPGSPAAKAGLRPGDIIQMVNDTKTDGLTTTEVADLLRGPRSTKVQVQVGREGVDMPVVFNIVRDEIPRFSVSGGFLLKPGIAFIRVESFNENTSQEMEEKFKKLGEKNVQGLILDLRSNPGGLLNEGVDVASHYLKKGDLVVSHHGRSSPNKNYTAPRDGSGKDYPIVVLVDRYTASAAEIVSGALQDHDRAWILGENTFGKGLVQTVYPMGDNTGLALTTAHYYTPSGRLIQRDYSNISFLDYYTHSNLELKNMQDVKTTDSGRTVYGGGGITPDEKYEPQLLNPFQISVRRKDAFFGFSAKYFGTRDTKLPQGWEPDAAILDQFHGFLKEKEVEFTEPDYMANRDWMRRELKREMYVAAFSTDESERVRFEQDPMVIRGMESLPKAKELLGNAKNMLVKRMNAQKNATVAAAR